MPKNPTETDVKKLNDLLAEIASDSLRRRESKEEHRDRLRALRDELDVAIDVAGM